MPMTGRSIRRRSPMRKHSISSKRMRRCSSARTRTSSARIISGGGRFGSTCSNAGRLGHHGVPAGGSLGGQAQHDQLRQRAPHPRSALAAGPPLCRGLHPVLVSEGQQDRLQFLAAGGRVGLLHDAGRLQPGEGASARSDQALQGLGNRPPRQAHRPLLAERQRRWDGRLHQRPGLSPNHQLLHVRQRHGHRAHRGFVGAKGTGRRVSRQGGGVEKAGAGEALEPGTRVLRGAPGAAADGAVWCAGEQRCRTHQAGKADIVVQTKSRLPHPRRDAAQLLAYAPSAHLVQQPGRRGVGAVRVSPRG